jgi:hypothetical protein
MTSLPPSCVNCLEIWEPRTPGILRACRGPVQGLLYLLPFYSHILQYWELKEEALDRTLWRTRFGRGYGPVVRQTAE